MLWLKMRLVGSRLEGAANQVRWLAGAAHRRSHPELWEIYLEDRRFPQVLSNLLTHNSNVVDVGCHIGSFLALTSRVAPDGHHVAFEASAAKAASLTRRFPGILVIPKAVCDSVGTAKFQQETGGRSGYSRLGDGPGSVEVETCTLDEALNEKGRIDLIKIDIEGGELAALKGGVRTIARHQPTIIFECGSEYFLKEHGLSRSELYEFINGELGYRIFSFADLLFGKNEMTFEEFRKCGLYPFRAFNFVAKPSTNCMIA